MHDVLASLDAETITAAGALVGAFLAAVLAAMRGYRRAPPSSVTTRMQPAANGTAPPDEVRFRLDAIATDVKAIAAAVQRIEVWLAARHS